MHPRYALVTGGNRGLGRAIAEGLAKSGVFAIIGSRDISNGNEVSSKIISEVGQTMAAAVELDVTSNESVSKAQEYIQKTFGKLDILINNAGTASVPHADDILGSTRQSFLDTLNTNVTSVAVVTEAFASLLKQSPEPIVINVGSSRGSLQRTTNAVLPPTISIPYNVSKTALNMLTVEYQKKYPEIKMHVISPGHLKTAFNGFRGKKDPNDGAKVVLALTVGENREKYGSIGFWEIEGDDSEPKSIQW